MFRIIFLVSFYVVTVGCQFENTTCCKGIIIELENFIENDILLVPTPPHLSKKIKETKREFENYYLDISESTAINLDDEIEKQVLQEEV